MSETFHRYVHNMSQPPKTAIVLAPHRPEGPKLSPIIALGPRWLPADDEHFADRLCKRLGLDPGVDPDEALLAWSEDLLDRLVLPHATLVHPAWGKARPRCDKAAAVAVLSRCSGQLFLRTRHPRFDHATLSRRIRVGDPALRRALRHGAHP